VGDASGEWYGQQKPAAPRAPGKFSTGTSSRGTLHTIFYNGRGLRAGWRLVIYILLVVIFSIAMNFALDKIFHLPKTATPAPGNFSCKSPCCSSSYFFLRV